jgi:hypothetical protein
MMYFLTPGSDAMRRFSEAVDRLMTGALVPGGTILVLGAYGPDYQEQVYRELDQRAAAAHLGPALACLLVGHPLALREKEPVQVRLR